MADDENEWRFELDDVGEDDADDAADGDDTAGDDAANRASLDEHGERPDDAESATDVAGDVGADQPIEPGSPRIENVVFVALGVLAAVVLVADFLSLAGL